MIHYQIRKNVRTLEEETMKTAKALNQVIDAENANHAKINELNLYYQNIQKLAVEKKKCFA